MSQEKKNENESEIYRCWLYKDGKAEIFEGEEIKKKEKEGWTDSPDKPSPKPDKTAAASGAVTKEN